MDEVDSSIAGVGGTGIGVGGIGGSNGIGRSSRAGSAGLIVADGVGGIVLRCDEVANPWRLYTKNTASATMNT